MTWEIGMPEDIALVDKLIAVLDTVDSDVTQQKAIEILMARLGLAASHHRPTCFFVIESMAKHAKQICDSLVGVP